MTKPTVRWRAISTKNMDGTGYECLLPDNFNVIYSGDLLGRIQSMEEQKPISFADAIHLIKTEIFECYKDKRLIEAEWTLNNFVEWVSCQGYHIILTGDEYEVSPANDLEKSIAFSCLKQFVHKGKHLVKWKAFKTLDQNGIPFDEQMPEIIEKHYRGFLLSKIIVMAEQKPISFEDAIKIVCKEADKAFRSKKFETDFGHYNWYINNFVDYIASLGFHIELSGDEFDLFQALDRVAFS